MSSGQTPKHIALAHQEPLDDFMTRIFELVSQAQLDRVWSARQMQVVINIDEHGVHRTVFMEKEWS